MELLIQSGLSPALLEFALCAKGVFSNSILTLHIFGGRT